MDHSYLNLPGLSVSVITTCVSRTFSLCNSWSLLSALSDGSCPSPQTSPPQLLQVLHILWVSSAFSIWLLPQLACCGLRYVANLVLAMTIPLVLDQLLSESSTRAHGRPCIFFHSAQQRQCLRGGGNLQHPLCPNRPNYIFSHTVVTPCEPRGSLRSSLLLEDLMGNEGSSSLCFHIPSHYT